MLLSIITITFRNIDGLRHTIQSIDAAISDVEQIVIDGASNDNSIEYLKNLNRPNFNWYSEPDHGIYDAMNKGLKKATGDYIIFMNAGDCFYSKETLYSLKKILQELKPDVLYGETMLVNPAYETLGTRSTQTTRKLPETLDWKSMKKGMLVSHQSFIIKRIIAPQYVNNNLSADIDWQIRGLKKSKLVIRHNQIISKYQTGGVSQQKHIRSLTDRFKVLSKHYGLVSAINSHLYFIIRSLLYRLNC